MNRLTIFATTLVALTIAGCVPSLHPFYTDDDVTFEKALVGTWAQKGGDTIWTFAKADDGAQSYHLVFKRKDDGEWKEATFEATLFKLDGRRYLDLRPKPKPLSKEFSGFYRHHFMPAHTLHQVTIDGDTVKLSMMSLNESEEVLKADAEALPHTFVDQKLLLTGSTKQLRAFVVEHQDDSDFFTDPLALKRK